MYEQTAYLDAANSPQKFSANILRKITARKITARKNYGSQNYGSTVTGVPKAMMS